MFLFGVGDDLNVIVSSMMDGWICVVFAVDGKMRLKRVKVIK